MPNTITVSRSESLALVESSLLTCFQRHIPYSPSGYFSTLSFRLFQISPPPVPWNQTRWPFFKRLEVGDAIQTPTTTRLHLHFLRLQHDAHNIKGSRLEIRAWPRQRRRSSPRFLERIWINSFLLRRRRSQILNILLRTTGLRQGHRLLLCQVIVPQSPDKLCD